MSTLKTGKVKTTTIADELDTESTAVTNVINGSAKAWVNWNGTGTVAIRASHNVTSITDNGAGDYTINFTNAMTDANYAVSGSAKEADSGTTDALFKIDEIGSNPAAGSVRINTGGATTSFDCNTVMASILS
jgi:hypothetical protein